MRGTAVPIHPGERHLLIDALRGLALGGVLLVNLGYLCLYELMSPAQQAALPSAGFDAVFVQVMQWLVSVKAITVFSVLFGLGFALQLERADARGVDGLGRFVRRLLWLLVIGLLHSYLVWWGDILSTYAIAGLLLVLFRRVPDSVLLGLGVFIALLLPGLLQPLTSGANLEALRASMFARSLDAFASNDAWRALQANADIATWTRLNNWTLVCFVLGRFLIGYWAGRRGLLQDPHAHRALIVRGFWITLAIAAASSATFHAVDAFGGWPREGGLRMLRGILFRTTPLALGIAYALGFALLFMHPRGARVLSVLAPLGRMALTHYLMQSVIGIVVFYGIGAGVGPWHGTWPWLLAWLAIFVAQIIASHVWLARFRYGPCEWAWRSLTYGTWQPMRRPRAALAS